MIPWPTVGVLGSYKAIGFHLDPDHDVVVTNRGAEYSLVPSSYFRLGRGPFKQVETTPFKGPQPRLIHCFRNYEETGTLSGVLTCAVVPFTPLLHSLNFKN